MKKYILIPVVVFMSAMLMFAASTSPLPSNKSRKGIEKIAANVEVTLQNKCTRDVKYTLKSGGATTNGVVPKADKVKISIAVGTEICVDGDAFMIVAATDAGQTFMVCR